MLLILNSRVLIKSSCFFMFQVFFFQISSTCKLYGTRKKSVNLIVDLKTLVGFHLSHSIRIKCFCKGEPMILNLTSGALRLLSLKPLCKSSKCPCSVLVARSLNFCTPFTLFKKCLYLYVLALMG